MAQDNLNVNYSKNKKINNKKPMRVSKLQKWVLTSAIRKPNDNGAKFCMQAVKDFSPKEYYFLSRNYIMKEYFGVSYTIEKIRIGDSVFEAGSIYRDNKPWFPIDKVRKRKAEVVLTRSLETMEEHGLIIRVGVFRTCIAAIAGLKSVKENLTDEEGVELIKDFSSKGLTKDIALFMRVIDCEAIGRTVKTKGIFLTDKGIEFRNKLLAENKG